MAGFFIYEAMLWEPADGYFLLDYHLRRLERSAAHFRFAVDVVSVRQQLSEYARQLPEEPRKVRLELAANGEVALNDEVVRPSTPLVVALGREPVRSSDEFLCHKTSRRQVFREALAGQPEAQDVLLWNERGELTETCHGNIVLEIGGRKLTPPVSCGLLPGVFRAYLLDCGEIQEEVLPMERVGEASAVYMINSVRKWCEARLMAG